LTLSLEKEEQANIALRKSEKDFQHAALHDSLTNLANRKQLGDILRKLIHDYKEDPSVTFHVLFLDISRFKNINDSLGHTFGDKVLMIAAKRFVRMLNPTDMVARIGGDEFAIILRNLSSVGKAQKVARRIFDSISQPFSLSGNNITISVNIGIAPCDAEYNTPEEVLRDADIAMHYAKEKNNGVAVFTKELRFRFIERVRYETDLRDAIDRNELSMHYQPLVDLKDGHLLGFEALLRWHHSEFGNIPPNKFIPIAEDSGLIIPITIWILKQTCTQLAHWQAINRTYRNLMVSVNISGKHLMHGDLIADVEQALEESKIDPSCLKLEITESTAMENADHTINVLNRLKQIGVKLSIDDFGTGYSSFSVLHKLPFDSLKIDRSFVYSVGENGENSEILQTIISLAKNLKMRVIAEGIETEAQLQVLQNLGCDYGQGYLLARPQTAEAAEKSLYESRNWLPVSLISDRTSTSATETDIATAF
jgi:diguanylate cyclase (GGDEF)-like protein